jgi:hypothetical protein
MYVLESRRLLTIPTHLPHALIERLGHPPVLEIYSPKVLPLRQLQKAYKGRIRKITLRSSSPFQLRIGQRLLITSDHRIVSLRDRSIPRLKIRAGPAFGSGEHATTHLCLRYLTQFLLQYRKSNPTVLDLGCGSGILALACAKLGVQALGWDLDPTAIHEAQRNAKVNRLTSISDQRRSSRSSPQGRSDCRQSLRLPSSSPLASLRKTPKSRNHPHPFRNSTRPRKRRHPDSPKTGLETSAPGPPRSLALLTVPAVKSISQHFP